MTEEEKPYKARPTQLPKPTFWPFFLAFGIVCVFWGILTNWIVSAVGFIVFAIALSGWITDINNELNRTKEDGL